MNPTTGFPAKHRSIAIAIFLCLATAAAFAQVRGHDFINFDDGLYVMANDHVLKGLTWEGIRWALSFMETVTYWQPLTFASHMLDVELFGLDPGAHHLVNLAWHMLNVLLLYFLFYRMTGCVRRSAVVAALFAVHPLSVESVAWVAERKNVLSTFFWLLTMHVYYRYARSPSLPRYAAVFGLFCMGMTVKPILSMLPFVLLLMDVWPIGRVRLFAEIGPHGPHVPQIRVRSAVMEKIPLFMVSFGLIYIGFFIDSFKDILVPVAQHPMPLRMANAVTAYVRYLGKLAWPFDLTYFYPFPKAVPWAHVFGASYILVTMTWLVLRNLKDRPVLAVGWFWFLGTLVPTSGLVQGGLFPALADRWAYVPMIGIWLIIAWALPDALIERIGRRRLSLAGTFLLWIVMSASWLQVAIWSDDISLGEHALTVTPENYVNSNNMALVRFDRGQYDEAEALYRLSLELNPRFVQAHTNMGNLLAFRGRDKEAESHYLEALRLHPEHGDAHFNLANLYSKKGLTAQAAHHYRTALKLKPDDAAAMTNLGNLLSDRGLLDEARDLYSAALAIRPDSALIHNNLGTVFLGLGQTGEALEHFRKAIERDPRYPGAHRNLLIALVGEGRISEARAHYRATIRALPALAAMPGVSGLFPETESSE